ncbi:F0F1 ATP synthase subunit epsilon [Blattabacterium cuenoti]|uniref:F0F1 ATP synthase subunit epsilon n=1 Tax=Blattabacterium cuenoti TaxID=1653831 RepID=UPI00163BC6A2|nr:F0F1 ATP synthase subunit epsilon [Blattabacterium cuenoti]
MKVTIINYEKVLYQDSAIISMTVPGINGSFQILENHDSMISLLGVGFLKLSHNNHKNFLIKKINGGLLQVKKNIVIVIL